METKSKRKRKINASSRKEEAKISKISKTSTDKVSRIKPPRTGQPAAFGKQKSFKRKTPNSIEASTSVTTTK